MMPSAPESLAALPLLLPPVPLGGLDGLLVPSLGGAEAVSSPLESSPELGLSPPAVLFVLS
ncbi:MAG TPA: hypothetical protein VG963_11770 [Polyangiaceae bacterium]|nr:hypothetical protein [Polyangiaceae bacterium]